MALRDKERQVADLTNSISRMESSVNVLQTELAATRDEQGKTLKQLNDVATVNTSLQQRLLEISKELEDFEAETSSDKKKADELRKKVEVLLDVN